VKKNSNLLRYSSSTHLYNTTHCATQRESILREISSEFTHNLWIGWEWKHFQRTSAAFFQQREFSLFIIIIQFTQGSSSKLHLTAEYYYYYRNKRKLFANDEKCKGKKKRKFAINLRQILRCYLINNTFFYFILCNDIFNTQHSTCCFV
jgi:hypothetical protein